MRVFGVLILAGAFVGVVGCKTNKPVPEATPTTATTAPAPEASQDTRPLLVCFGDSLTAGYGADPGSSYPDFLQKDLDTAGYLYRVVNEGVSGNTTKDGVERLPGVIAMHPAAVIVEFGGNDGLRGLKVQITRENLATIISGIKASGAKVLIAGISLPPDFGPDYVSTFTANYASLAKQFNVPLYPFMLKDVYGIDGMMQADRTHATNAGNEIVARNVMAAVTPLLHK
ncbi:arylesterase [Granulicella sibirica]|uniref:Arylesterase n=1 Tax=Granulicella sibirica TaxID=2479048 RepID=A0A4Q0SWX5_9BACT|nr:arylesterase [Granulicella sibirica]RXH55317.1 Arylesterase precursor [Granulicella sibirica]